MINCDKFFALRKRNLSKFVIISFRYIFCFLLNNLESRKQCGCQFLELFHRLLLDGAFDRDDGLDDGDVLQWL